MISTKIFSRKNFLSSKTTYYIDFWRYMWHWRLE